MYQIEELNLGDFQGPCWYCKILQVSGCSEVFAMIPILNIFLWVQKIIVTFLMNKKTIIAVGAATSWLYIITTTVFLVKAILYWDKLWF